MKSYLYILSFACTSFCFSQNITSQIDSILESEISQNDPGLFIGVVQNGEIIYEGYGGMSDLQHQVNIDETSRCNIASTAKQFTALMILDLSLKGKLSLEDDIRKYLTDLYPNVKEEIKIRNLINHTSGIRDYCDLMSIQRDPWWRREGLDNDDILELMQKQQDLAFAPGTDYSYSNSGYILLTKIIEAIAETDFASYSNEFFQNIGMNNTSSMDNYMAVIPNIALPYSDWGDGKWQQWPTLVEVHGDGALYTTLHDQLIYELAVQNAIKDENELLINSQKSIPNAAITDYGFGLEIGEKLGFDAIHHAGGTGAFHSQMYRFPDQKLSVFVMSNNGNLWVEGIAANVARVFLPKKERIRNYPIELAADNKSFTNKDALGYYASSDGYIICIESSDDKLQWRNATNDPYPLTMESTGVYAFEINPRLKAIFANDRVIYSTGKGVEEEYFRLDIAQPTENDFNQLIGAYNSEELDTGFEIYKEGDKIMISVDGGKNGAPIEIVNKDKLMVLDYFLTIERDGLDRTNAILLSYERAWNVRFKKTTELKTNASIKTEEGSITVSTVQSKDGKSSNILVTENNKEGNEIWFKQYGGKSYDRASSIYATEDGYVIVGSTSSFGAGNYDVIALKIDKNGKKKWQNTYGLEMNDYGYDLEATDSGYLIKATTQSCVTSNDLLDADCSTNIWIVTIDNEGNEISNDVLEAFDD